MIRLLIILLGFGGVSATPDQPFWAAYNKQVTKELTVWSDIFNKAEHIKTTDTREFYRILSRSGETAGTLVLTSAQGRFERFDLMVVIDPAGKISLIRILKYRSEYGSEVTNKKWLAQFYTKPDSTFALHKNIDAISGATYSSHGLIDEINFIMDQMTDFPGSAATLR
ncbi:MAG: FMN-binding protein [Bacteroidales bacterium]